MNLLRTALGLAFVLAHAAVADVQVLFQNNVFTPARLVTFPFSLPPPLDGNGVRNGVYNDSNFIAQLFLVTGSGDIPIGPPANFRVSTTTQPGTWQGGLRTIPGVNPGERVYLVVKVWDNSRFHSHYVQSIESPSRLYGRSEVFSYTQPVNPQVPSDLYMTEFSGFGIGHPLTPSWVFVELFASAQPFSLLENETAQIPNPVDKLGRPLPQEEWGAWRSELRFLFPMPTGSIGGSLQEVGPQSFYAPAPNHYGDFKRYGIIDVQVLPSPKRPYLELVPTLGTSARRLVLRGLAPKRYRVEQSSDLGTWTPVGEFTANHSEVPVQDLALADATARFFRVVELLP